MSGNVRQPICLGTLLGYHRHLPGAFRRRKFGGQDSFALRRAWQSYQHAGNKLLHAGVAEVGKGSASSPRRFDDAATTVLAERPGDIAELQNHPDYALAVPTPDHFLPLLYIAGIAAASGKGASCLVRGCTLGSVSMTCHGVGTDEIGCSRGGAAAGVPSDVPPDQTNL